MFKKVKKKILTVILILYFIQLGFSQGLINWKHYYAQTTSGFDIGNYLASAGPEEIILRDKSTSAITRIPYPSDIRNINSHNSQYFISGNWYTCSASLMLGPAQTLILQGCSNNNYQYDGTSWLPFNNYLGFNINDISFLPYAGGSTFFISGIRLNKYDGNNLTYFDTTNSPYYTYNCIYNLIAANDDILLNSIYNIAIYHNGVWANYDTTFFNSHYFNIQVGCTSLSSDFTFFDQNDTSFHTFINSSGTWKTTHIPSSMNHYSSDNYGPYVFSSKYDSNGDLWLSGDSVFCRFDGTQFYDYFNHLTGHLSLLNNITIESILAGNNILITDSYSEYIFNSDTYTVTPYSDPQAVLSGNALLPSLKDSTGNLWFGACGGGQENGLMKYDGSAWKTFNTQGIVGSVYAIKQDTGQTILLGSTHGMTEGLIQLHDTTLTELNIGFYNDVEDIALDHNHHCWFGGGDGIPQGLAEYYSGNTNLYSCPTSSDNVYVLNIDSLDNKWVSFDSFDGVYKFDGTTWINYKSNNSPLPNDTVVSIVCQPKTNTIWFCTNKGFARFRNGDWTIFNTSNTPLPDNHAEFVYFAQDSTIWFGTQKGFATLNGTTWETYTTYNSPLHNSDIESIVVDDDCTVWICTESGLTSAQQPCGASISVSGSVYQANNAAADNTLVYVYKLNNNGTDINQVDNVFTDNYGQFSYFTRDTGTYFFQANVNSLLNPEQLTGYEDSAFVIQQSSPLHITTNGIYSAKIKLKHSTPSIGNCSFNGKLKSATERTGSVRLVLMLNGLPVASVLSNVDGTFKFKDIAQANYTLWVDKLGLNNSNAPLVAVSCLNGVITYPFQLYPDHLVLLYTNVSTGAESGISIFPNPFDDKITIIFESISTKSARLKVIDISGKQIYASDIQLQQGVNIINLDGSIYKAGIYFIQLSTVDKMLIGKLVK